VSDASCWSRQDRFGSAASLCGRWPPAEELHRRTVATCHVTGAALVLGGAQRAEAVSVERCARDAVEIARRPAGGGAVFVAPGAQVWIDFWMPRGDALWDEDVVRCARWLGEAWARALAALGVHDLEVHQGRSIETKWSRLVCFAGLGPGEVNVAGVKVVGIAQRRTREGARFFTVAALRWDPSSVVGLMSLEKDQAAQAISDLANAATGLRDALPGVDPEAGGSSTIAMIEREVERSLP
jgi:lipoate-protein ligase A